MSDLVADLREDENEVLHVYPDSDGYATIGIGILIDARRGGGITKEESAYLLNNRIVLAKAALNAKFPWFAGLDAVRQDGLTNMAFQLGIGGVLGFPHALRCIAANDWIGAERELKDSLWFKSQTPARAARVINQIVTGKPRHVL